MCSINATKVIRIPRAKAVLAYRVCRFDKVGQQTLGPQYPVNRVTFGNPWGVKEAVMGGVYEGMHVQVEKYNTRGLHARRTLPAARRQAGTDAWAVIVAVRLWGRVAVGRLGYRAEYARIVAIHDNPKAMMITPTDLRALATQYRTRFVA